jgi:hypothetical protein
VQNVSLAAAYKRNASATLRLVEERECAVGNKLYSCVSASSLLDYLVGADQREMNEQE